MSLSAREAAALVGMSKPGIVKAIKCGKLSAEKDIHGEWGIDPAELFRVYEAVGASTHQPSPLSLLQDAPSMQRENELLRKMLADKDDVIADLRATIEAERKLTMLLADKQQPRSWWQRLLGGG